MFYRWSFDRVRPFKSWGIQKLPFSFVYSPPVNKLMERDKIYHLYHLVSIYNMLQYMIIYDDIWYTQCFPIFVYKHGGFCSLRKLSRPFQSDALRFYRFDVSLRQVIMLGQDPWIMWIRGLLGESHIFWVPLFQGENGDWMWLVDTTVGGDWNIGEMYGVMVVNDG